MLELNNIYGLIGIISTFIVGIIGFWMTLKFRNKNRISFIVQECYALLNSVVQNLDQIKIEVRGSSIDKNIIFFKGLVINSGQLDVQKSDIYKPLSISLPKDFNWLEVSNNTTEEGIDSSLLIVNNDLIIDWSILRTGEVIGFDSIIEYKGSESYESFEIQELVSENLKFTHRITNLSKVDYTHFIFKTSPNQRGLTFSKVIFRTLSILLIAGILSMFVGGYSNRTTINDYISKNGVEEKVKYTVSQNNILILDSKGQEIFKKEEVLNEYNGVYKKIDKGNVGSLFYFGLILSLFTMFYLFIVFLQHKREDKFIKIMKE